MSARRGDGEPRPPRRSSARGQRGCLARAGRALVWLLVLGLLAGGGLAAWGWWSLRTPRAFAGERRVEVAPGMGAGAILAALERADVIPSRYVARAWLLLRGNPPLQAGEYVFRPPLTPEQALGKIIRGEVAAHRVTVIEGLTLEEVADRLAAAKLGDRDAFLRLMRDPAPVRDLDPEAPDLEGYLFPDSYSFTAGTPPRQVVDTLVGTFAKRWRHDVVPRLPAGSAARTGGRSVREIVTLASIVEKEARLAAERPLIAAVYANRLQRGMGLYADPTVIYALKKANRWDGNITKADLQLDSPYNTYRRAGLPPGPICSPGVGSLLAAAAPADVPYLYFVARNDGSHVFATTLEEHNHNVAIWQRRYWRERREREATASATPAPTPADVKRPARRR